jgi:hypothetical protein
MLGAFPKFFLGLAIYQSEVRLRYHHTFYMVGELYLPALFLNLAALRYLRRVIDSFYWYRHK